MASHVVGDAGRGPAVGAALGEPLEAAVIGKGIGALAREAAAKNLAKVWAVEHDLLDSYTADGYTAALEQLIQKTQPTLVLFPHTYQVRDFAPKLATRFSQVLVSDVIAARVDGGDAGARAAVVPGQAERRCAAERRGSGVRVAAGGRVAGGRAGERFGAGRGVSRQVRGRADPAEAARLRSAKPRARWI